MNVNDIKLFPHNQETYDKIQEAWITSNKVATVQATGTGKSYLILKCLYNIPNENKIVLAPSNYILEQVEKEAGEIIPNTTLLTYSKLSYMTDEELQSLNPYLIVLDEFHRCGAEQWGNGIEKLLNMYSNAKILGTSATHIRYLDDNRNMADELFQGNVVTNLSLAEAIVKRILPMPKYISALYTFDDEVNNLKTKVQNSKNSDESKEELLKEIDLMRNKLDKSKGIPKILKKHLSESNNYKFIIFCKDIKHLDDMRITVVEWFKKAKISKNIKVYTAYTGYGNTDKEINEFTDNNDLNSAKLLFSIDMFNEGIHIKDVSGVILLRPTISPIIYYQQIGRAIQAGNNNNNPLIFDFVNNFDSIGAGNFINDIKEYSERGKIKLEDSENKKDFLESLEFMIIDEIKEAKDLFESIEVELYNTWDYYYNKYKEFNLNENIIDKKFLRWITEQRRCYKSNSLSNEKIEKLNLIGFVWDEQEEKWLQSYNKLKDFYLKCNNTNIPRTEEYKKLQNWIDIQRNLYKKDKLVQNRINLLNTINFQWEAFNDKWRHILSILVEYKKENGSAVVPQKTVYKNERLGVWLAHQKQLYKNNKLSKERVEALNEVSFDWAK